jgi:4-hydroxybenzoate polyprenyltransferase
MKTLDERNKILLKGLLRTVITFILVALAMILLGEFEERSWILYLGIVFIPWYWVYQAYFKKNTA